MEITIKDLITMLEKNTRVGDFGNTDYIFDHEKLLIRNTIFKINNERVVIISTGDKEDNLETVSTTIYDREVLDEHTNEVLPLHVLRSNPDLMEAYGYSSLAYVSIVEKIIGETLLKDEELSDEGFDSYKIPSPKVIWKNNIVDDVDQNAHNDERLSTTTYNCLEDLVDGLTKRNFHSIQEMTILVSNKMSIEQEYWNRLHFTKSMIFGEMHYVLALVSCSDPEIYADSYILNTRYLGDVPILIYNKLAYMRDMCTKVSDNPIEYTLKVIETID